MCRSAAPPFGAEVAPVDPNCGGAAEIFVGFAVFIDGARPDVAAAFPAYPQAHAAGWGFMVLDEHAAEPGQRDVPRSRCARRIARGTGSCSGTRTMTCANASATLPFGTIDTPVARRDASGASYINFGWALTPLPKTIPIDGSTIRVLVDGVDVGPADYNHARSDIQAVFPGFNNTNGAVGFRILDTTALANGLHTISWMVTDNAGRDRRHRQPLLHRLERRRGRDGGRGVRATSPSDLDAAPLDTTPLVGRRGWDLEAPFGLFERRRAAASP